MKKRVDVHDLGLGMYVSELDRPWLGTPFLFQGFRIEDPAHLTELQQLCQYVYVDPEKSTRAAASALKTLPDAAAAAEPADAADARVPFKEQMAWAREVYQRATAYVERLFQELRQGRTIDPAAAREVVDEVLATVLRSPDALLLISNLKAKDENAGEHSLAVCTLSLILGRELGMDRSALEELGMAALLHDVGKSRVPEAILAKRGALSAKERALLQAHTEYGAEMLAAIAGLPTLAAEVAYTHHERVNGKGYPQGLGGEALSLQAGLVGLVNAYEDVTGGRGQPGLTPSEALKTMYDWRDVLFDGRLVEQFIQCLGVYPVGSVVQLNSGESGVVISVPPTQRLAPTVLLLRDAAQRIYEPPRIINLVQYRSPEGSRYEIVGVLGPDSLGVDLKNYLLRELPS